MFINKIGQQHIEIGMNNQDYGLETDKIKLVCDGCSEGRNTEVGAKTYSHLISKGYNTEQAFEKLIDIFGDSSSSIRDYLCFTIIHMDEQDDNYVVSYCGDGYIILQDNEDKIVFEELNDGEYPKYYAYNYVNPETLKYYKDGVSINYKTFSKKDYKNVGVASDGLRFILKSDNYLLSEFEEMLKYQKAIKIKRFINKYQSIFKDDITIVF